MTLGFLLTVPNLAQRRSAEGSSSSDNIGQRAIVAAQRQDLRAGVIPLELPNVGWRSAAKAIDRLILIADDPDIGALARQQLEQHAAGAVDVLKLIDQNLLIALLYLGQRRRRLPEKAHGQQ